MKSALEKINPKTVAIGEIRGRGLMVGMEIVKDKESKEPAGAEAGKVKAAMREKGVMIGLGGVFGNVLRIQPPLTISHDELEKAVLIMKTVLET